MLRQRKIGAAVEVSVNLALGFTISTLLAYYVLPFWGFAPSLLVSAEITAAYTVVSFVRSFMIRRLFESRRAKVLAYKLRTRWRRVR